MNKCLLGLFFLLCGFGISAQFEIGISVGGISYHPGDNKNAAFYKWKLSKDDRFGGFGGVTISASYRINDYIGIKAVQSFIFHDSAGKRAGISHVGVQLHDDIFGMKSLEHQFSMSFGPFWYYRKNWSDITDYKNDPDFITLGIDRVWERKFVWYGGFMRYDCSLNESDNLAVDLLPGYPHIYAISAGWNKNL